MGLAERYWYSDNLLDERIKRSGFVGKSTRYEETLLYPSRKNK